MLQGGHSAILSTFIKLPIVIKIFVLSIISGRFTQVLLYLEHQTGYRWVTQLSCVVSLSKTLNPLLSTGSTQEEINVKLLNHHKLSYCLNCNLINVYDCPNFLVHQIGVSAVFYHIRKLFLAHRIRISG